MSLFVFFLWCFLREQSLQFSGKDYHQEFSSDGIVTSKNKKVKTEFQSQKIKTEELSQPQQNRPLGQYLMLILWMSRFWVILMHLCTFKQKYNEFKPTAKSVSFLLLSKNCNIKWLDLTNSGDNDSNSLVPVSLYVYFSCVIECFSWL